MAVEFPLYMATECYRQTMDVVRSLSHLSSASALEISWKMGRTARYSYLLLGSHIHFPGSWKPRRSTKPTYGHQNQGTLATWDLNELKIRRPLVPTFERVQSMSTSVESNSKSSCVHTKPICASFETVMLIILGVHAADVPSGSFLHTSGHETLCSLEWERTGNIKLHQG